jgi:Na+-driven multidrug efflux pump
VEVVLMARSLERFSVRVLLLQMTAHALIFAGQNAGNLTERALLATDTVATAALGLSWTAFCLVSAFTTSLVSVCPLVVGRRTGNGDEGGARSAVRQGLLLAVGGGMLGLAVAVAAAVVATLTSGPARDSALFLAAQGLALGPSLGARALIGYFSGTLRVGPALLATMSALPVAIHLMLACLLTGLLSWSLAGAGVARLGAAVAVFAVTVAVVRTEFRGFLGPGRRSDRALLWRMFTEGSALGLQQVAAGLTVVFLYLAVAGAGDVTAAALTLTHSGIYPLLFAFAWGLSQAVGAAAAQAVGRRDARELTRIIWLSLGLSAVLVGALPWGAYALCGRQTLAWLVEDSPESQAVLAASERFMGLLAIFFVFDFAINFLSALLRAAEEQVYLLEVTAATAAGFGILVIALPLPPDGTCLMGTFILAQAAWAVLLLVRVVTRWPCLVRADLPVAPADDCHVPEAETVRDRHALRRLEARHRLTALASSGADSRAEVPDRFSYRKVPREEHPAMDPLNPNTAPLSPTQRALALGLLVEMVVPMFTKSRGESAGSGAQSERGGEGQAELWRKLRAKCDDLATLVLWADDRHEAAAYVLGYLPKHLDYLFELLSVPKRAPVLESVEAGGGLARRNGKVYSKSGG